MARVSLSFDMDDMDEKTSARQALKADDVYILLWRFDQALRNDIKYSETTKDTEHWRNLLRSMCDDFNINIEGE